MNYNKYSYHTYGCFIVQWTFIEQLHAVPLGGDGGGEVDCDHLKQRVPCRQPSTTHCRGYVVFPGFSFSQLCFSIYLLHGRGCVVHSRDYVFFQVTVFPSCGFSQLWFFSVMVFPGQFVSKLWFFPAMVFPSYVFFISKKILATTTQLGGMERHIHLLSALTFLNHCKYIPPN